MTWLAIAAGALLLIGAIAISHSRFSADLAVIDRAWADVTADLGRRYELVPRFVETVRGQAPNLGRDLDDVVVARSRAIQMSRQAPGRVAMRADVENDLTTAIARVMTAVGDDDATTPAVVAASDDLTTVHARISADAHLYNLAVQGHNRRVTAAPTRLVAALFGIERRPYLTMVDPSPAPATE
jgi:LemA protein